MGLEAQIIYAGCNLLLKNKYYYARCTSASGCPDGSRGSVITYVCCNLLSKSKYYRNCGTGVQSCYPEVLTGPEVQLSSMYAVAGC